MPRKRISDTDVTVARAASAAPRRQTAAKTRTPRARTTAPSAAISPAPSREEIARLAYSFWEARACQGGSPEEDWLRAELQLSARVAAAVA